ncbi:MAG TPA: hypothetical protein VFN10_14250 [Thermoanaerobaculia bacterium]|nr:hypothetical protein [Thermoanaerobaculia bacterium]
MKAIAAVLALVLVVVPSAFAGCPTISGPYICCGTAWYQYSWSTSCAGTTGNVSNATMWCYSTPAKAFGTGSSSATYSYTIGSSDPIANHWSADLRYVEWSDPNGSASNTLSATLSVTHNGSTTSRTLFSVNGQSSKSCSLEGTGATNFDAAVGDTVTITINASIVNSNVTAQVGAPTLYTVN